MSYLAKPDAKTEVYLDQHVEHLQNQWENDISPLRKYIIRKYADLTGQDLEKLVWSSIRWHDEGKKDDRWQNACRKDFAESRRTGRSSGRHLQKAGIRHELASLQAIHDANAKLSVIVRAAIAAHHGKLSHKHHRRWGEEHPAFEKFWLEFARIANGFRLSDLDAVILKRYEFAGPRSLLQLVDHRASALESGEQPQELAPFQYTFPYAKKHGVQKLVENLWDEPFAILRAPTGSGKTDAALIWAQHQIEHGKADRRKADRMVIAMPTRFTANALAISTAKNLAKNGVYHSSAWFAEGDKRILELARLLETPVTVTTIDHLCISLTATREDHHGIFFNLANSCVVIDEADFYDDFTQQNIVVLLHVLRLLKVPVLLMSATVPESARKLYAHSGFVIPPIFEDTTDYELPRCMIQRVGRNEKPDDIQELLTRALQGEPTIIYANTVRRAQAYYQWFQDRGFQDVVLYHSRFTEPHKADKERQLYGMLGHEAWGKHNEDGRAQAHGVAVLTQIGELSVNISADLMISDLCPIDRLAQRVGRLSRFDKSKVGELFVVDPVKVGEDDLYPAPYGKWITNKGWELSAPLEKSNVLLENGLYTAKRFVDLVNEVYSGISEIQSHTRANKEKLENCIVFNWLIGPAERVEEDDEGTKDWKSRDIPAQKVVYADYEISGFSDGESQDFPNWQKFREFRLKHGIQCHAYEFEQAEENGRLEGITFLISSSSRDEYQEEKGWVVKRSYYNFDKGLHFDLGEGD